jgi:hypothetical protein
MTFSCIIFQCTPSRWWRSSSTSMRCTWACGHRCTCSGSSTSCVLSKKGFHPLAATTSSTGPRVRLCTLPPSPPSSGTTGGMIGRLCRQKSMTSWCCRPLRRRVITTATNLQSAYLPVLKRIQFLAENGLSSMMVLFDFLLKHIAPL